MAAMVERRTHTERQLTPRLLVAAYAQGCFPMARSAGSRDIHWFSPDPRAVIPLDKFHVPRTLRQKVRQGVFDVRFDTAFEQVIRRCAEPREDDCETWINDEIVEAYTQLHRLGLAHSVEAWRAGGLVGGLYGVALNGAFFGESMFHDPAAGGTDASKVCLVHLVEHLKRRGFTLLDIQWITRHLRRFGAVEIPRRRYMRMLTSALDSSASWSSGHEKAPSRSTRG
mgnify:CR=1 FL=1